MSSVLRVDNLANATSNRSMADIYTGSAKIIVNYQTISSAPSYTAVINESFGVSSVTDVQVGVVAFTPSVLLDTALNRRPVLCSTSTNYDASSFGYNGALYTGTAYRVGYYTTGFAAGVLSCTGY